MLGRLIGQRSLVSALKQGLDESTLSVRQIGQRVANAANNGGASFQSALAAVEGEDAGKIAAQVDLEAEMVALADEQLRFEATSRLLQKVYQQIRSSLRDR